MLAAAWLALPLGLLVRLEVRRGVPCTGTSQRQRGKEGACVLADLGDFHLQSQFDSNLVENHLCLLKKWYQVIVHQIFLFFFEF